jgi:uncharacterized protein YjdB
VPAITPAARAATTLAVLVALAPLAACDARLDPITAASIVSIDSTARDTSGATAGGTGVIALSASAAELRVGSTLQLSASGDPALFPVQWSTDTPAVAAVSATGLVTGLAVGTARITARSAVNPLRAASATVRVTASP